MGVIAKYEEDGFPVILKLVDEMPCKEIRKEFRWLTLISWKYDGSTRNGMPEEGQYQSMVSLEHAIKSIEKRGVCRHAYSRTGNGLKELVYYTTDQSRFMEQLNLTLSSHPKYPIEISFYEDEEWKDLRRILGGLKSKDGAEGH